MTNERAVVHRKTLFWVPALVAGLGLADFDALWLFTGTAAAADAPQVDFNRDVRPLLSNTCYKCHGPDEKERQGGLRLDTEQGALADLGGHAAIAPGRPGQSELIRRVGSADPDQRMPPPDSGKQLTAREIQLLTDWVAQGALFARHWSYVAPVRPSLPHVANTAWPRNEIDGFLLARLEQERLSPAEEADRYALVRRVTLDLTGLPPSIADADAFAADPRPDAYERLVDRLLADKRFGEHWARLWLDLARYADSAGYADDPPRTIWAYRDYVIESLNANKPFDQFTVEQLAGDLLDNPSEEQRIATAFHRNTLTNSEGGTNDEEFRNVAIVDRVNTTFAVWMGTTIACAQCHTHKYDPITQHEFFQVFAFLNNTADADRGDETPLFSLFSTQQLQRRAELEAEIAKRNEELAAAADDAAKKPLQDRIAELQKQLGEVKPRTTVPVLQELPDGQRRTTLLQHRGNFLDTGDEVNEGVPAAFPPLPADAPRNRLTLARWIASAENPLTARVMVNRLWEHLFGLGIVPTSEEFGTQGDPPTHAELLDWLATELVRSGWNVKHLLRLMVTSAAYRQSSKVSPELLARDPDNRLLSRGPRFRLSAEMVRDQALAVAGLLSEKTFGASVQPPRPVLGLTAAFGGSTDWETSAGDDRYRRGLYTQWRRSMPYPSMSTFDAPNREVCTVHRARTNTPLQALVTLNDPVYVEAAQALARRMAAQPGDTAEKAAFGFRLCVARPPSERETRRLVELYEAARVDLAQRPEAAAQLATEPLGPLPAGMDAIDAAAWTVIGNVLLNLDEALMKR